MKISDRLPKFEGQVALVVTTDKKEADFYIATEGFITSVRTLKTSLPKYTDREGFFESRGSGKVYGSGSVYEKKKEKLEHEFLPEFVKTLEDVNREYKVTDFYLFAPAYLINDIKHAIPKKISLKLRLAVGRNYFGRHPFKLLEKIRSENRKMPPPDRPVVQKILKRRTISPTEE